MAGKGPGKLTKVSERDPYPLIAKLNKGCTVPWIAALELTGHDPRDPHLGTDKSDYHPDAAIMIRWIQAVDVKSINLLCDLLMAIEHGRIWSKPTYIQNGRVLDPFKQQIRMSEAERILSQVKQRSKAEAELLLKELIGGAFPFGDGICHEPGRPQGRPSSQDAIIEACRRSYVSGMSAMEAYRAALKAEFPELKGDPPKGWSERSFKRGHKTFLGQKS